LPILKSVISGKDYNIKKLRTDMKDKLKKDMYEFFRQNEELVDFMLKYEI
jgi:hypothetical protein